MEMGVEIASGCFFVRNENQYTCLFRFNSLSLVYLLYLLLLPWFLGPTEYTMKGHTGRLLRALLGTSILFLLAHLVFQICLYTIPSLDQLLGHNCSTWEILAQHIGVTRLHLNDIPNSVRLVAPDFGILLVSAICLGVCSRLKPTSDPIDWSRRPEQEEAAFDGGESKPRGAADLPAEASPRQPARLPARLRITAHRLLMVVWKVLAIVLLALAGITLPSAFSSVYYLVFVGLCTWWACHFPASHLAFSTLCVMVDVFAGGHLICLYGYQTPFIQKVLPSTSLWARLFGLKAIVRHVGCSKPNALLLDVSLPWPVYVNPGILLLLYYVLATLVKLRRSHFYEQQQRDAASSTSEFLELEDWSTEREALSEDAEPMLVSETEASGADSEDCTVHVIGEAEQPAVRKRECRKENPLLHSLGHVVMNQSYVCALIAMMVWSITYHSWLTFVLLLWACLIWIVRNRHHFAMLCSPFILLYGIALCSLQYVWGMDLEPELPTKVGVMPLEQLGLVRPQYPCLYLGAKLLYTLTFWLLVRQFVKEKLLKKKKPPAPLVEVTVAGSGPGHKRDVLKILGSYVMGFYAKFWILVCAGMFIVVSFAGRLVVYKIVYMFLFLLCLTLFQVYYSLWRKLLKAFWWLVVAYTMLVLIAIYTFRFKDFPMYWRNFTGLTDEQLGDLGLEQFSVSELFSSIFIPGFFLLACILQLHYFHRPFMRITDLEHVIPPGLHGPEALGIEEVSGSLVPLHSDDGEAEDHKPGDKVDAASEEALPGKWGLVLERLMVLGRKFSNILSRIRVFVLRLLELHILKLVALYIVWVALQEVSVMNFLLVVLWAFAVPYSRFSHMASCLSTVWVCIIIVCKMLYQLKIVNPEEYATNCTEPQLNSTNLQPEEIGNSTLYQHPVDPANWFGIRKGYPNLGYIQNHLQVLVLLVFEAIVYRCQEYYRKQHQLVPPLTQTIFQDGTRQNLDKGLLNCLKYFVNYLYYKFGLEICFLMTVNVIGQRMNFMVIFHGCWLVVILTRRRRHTIARLWPKYCLFLVLFLLFQYLLCMGIPPVLCIDYPWRWSNAIPINSVLIKWMYFPDFFMKPNSINLMSDFLLLLCASRQWKVFGDEQTEEWVQLAGDNREHLEPLQEKPNPVPNFVNCRSYLDMLKVCVFRYFFWFVLVIVFVAGANRISVFGLGYLMACFFLLLFGTAMLRRPLRARLVLWDCLILYNVTVIIAKNMLSLLSCVFVQQMQNNFCWVIQLFSLACTVKGYYDPKDVDKNQDCALPVEEAGIIWDSICFFFLLLQRRVFLSYYFMHVVADLQASALQASRGFALYKARMIKSMSFHHQTEKKSLVQLKRQMERIRAKQEKYHQGQLAADSEETLETEQPESGTKKDASRQRKQWWRPWQDHATGAPRSVEGDPESSALLSRQEIAAPSRVDRRTVGKRGHYSVLHSGDYFLFETDSEEDEESVLEDQRPPKQSAFQLAYQAWMTSTKSALRERKQREQKQRETEKAEGDSTKGEPQQGELTDRTSGEEEEEEEAVPVKSNVVQRVLNMLGFLWVLCQATVDGLTRWLCAFTKEHEQMSTVLGLERFVLTQQLHQAEEFQRSVLDRLYQPAATDDTSEDTALPGTAAESPNSMASSGCEGAEVLSNYTTGYDTQSASEEQIPAVGSREDVGLLPSSSQELLACSKARPRTASELLLSRHVSFEELEESECFYHSQNRFLQLLLACYHSVAGHSDLLCYFIIILNNMVTASVISVVLPILIFLWAMLSIPRPSKRFWMTAIIYTEVMVVVKYLFQFGFFPWNSYTTLVRYEARPFFPPRILGLEKTDNYLKYDLIQLMALFFHRSLLLSYGLWDHEEDVLAKHQLEAPEPSASTESKEEAGTLVEADAEAESVAGQKAEPEPEVRKGIRARFRKRKEKKKQSKARKKEQVEEALEEQGEQQDQKDEERKSSPSKEKLKAAGLRAKNFLVSAAAHMFQPLKRFFQDILHSKYRAATDVYALMFLADVVDFIIIIFGFWAFGKHSAAADITSSLSDDQVPQAFLVMLLIQFSTMVIDRALYLRKSVLGKLIFQVLLVFGIHVWMFFILPAVTERMFSLNTVAQLWYFVKCIYFALSAYQIRCGYPTRILGNFLTKKYNHLNLFLFQGFRLVPFLVELRAVMDWVWTDTTLSLSNWMCVEDIYANIFIIKCSRETEKKYPQPKGQKKKKIVKYGMGGLIILFLICIIWFPLLFMSLVRSVVGVVNHPIDVTVTLKLGGYEPLFTMSAQQQSIQDFTPKDYDALTEKFERQPVAMQFITLYGYEDIVTARIEGSSGSLWSISPPSREQLQRELHNSSSAISLRFTWNFQRDLGKGGTVEYTSEKHTMHLDQNSTVRSDLAGLLQGTHNAPVRVPHLFPPYIRAPNGPEANPVEQLLPDEEDSYLDVEVQLKRQRVGPGNDGTSFLEWWMIRLADCKGLDCNFLPMVIFSDKVSPPSLGFLAGYGIMGLYVSIVLVIGKFVRGFFSEISHSIMFEELPCVDRILKLCHDIFLVRETGELELEEELYAKLIFLYRSPETMIKWTREKE
ncbi:piezo-type mechanosensitive ion channel component 1 isoform X4 [Rhineura floridana]|uniref:piezo-type mechanosensitive ion channel component 1 isoform X4 n=1 Tax=Rhineura floridana TaxID=261503 RepID=UPI002AC83160|nr:piezo-type mechanosensitive ion channel component 1 isoform X4 [Rhineura floridana]